MLIIRCQISSISQANMVSRRGEEGGLNTHNYIDTSNNTAAAQYGAIEAAAVARGSKLPYSTSSHYLTELWRWLPLPLASIQMTV